MQPARPPAGSSQSERLPAKRTSSIVVITSRAAAKDLQLKVARAPSPAQHRNRTDLLTNYFAFAISTF